MRPSIPGLRYGLLLFIFLPAVIAGLLLARRLHPSIPLPPPRLKAPVTGSAPLAGLQASSDEGEAPITPWTGADLGRPDETPGALGQPTIQPATPPHSAERLAIPGPKVASSSDGGWFAAGFVSGRGAVLAKMGPDGTPLWGNDGMGLDLEHVVSLTALEPSLGGGCFLSGTYSLEGSPQPDDQKLFIAYFDRNGVGLWRSFQEPLLLLGDRGEYRVNVLLPLRDGGCLALGNAHEREGDSAWALRLAQDGTPAWTRHGLPGLCFNDGGAEKFTRALQLPDGGFLAIGSAGLEPAGLFLQPHGQTREAWKAGCPYNFVPMQGDGWILRLDSDGHSLLNATERGAGLRYTGTHFADAALDPSGRVYLAGSVWGAPTSGSAGAVFLCVTGNAHGVGTLSSKPIAPNMPADMIIPLDGGGGFTRISFAPDGGCLLLGRGCPKGSQALKTWVVRLTPDEKFAQKTDGEPGAFLPEENGHPLTDIRPIEDGSSWLLTPRSTLPTTRLRTAKVNTSGEISWLGDGIFVGQASSVAPLVIGNHGYQIQGFGDRGPWQVLLDQDGRQRSTGLRP